MKLTDGIIKRIKELMKRDNITQYQLAEFSGLTQSTISSVLRRQVESVQIFTLFDICFGLNIELSDFFDCDYLKFENVER